MRQPKIIGLEEHFITADVRKAWQSLDPQWQDAGMAPTEDKELSRLLTDLGPARIAALDKIGLDMQVLSLTAPGLHGLAPADAVTLQKDTNDLLADAVRAHPDRLQGFATLATPAPAEAARELERGP